MKFNFSKLRGKMAEEGYTVRSLSEKSGIPVSTLSNKLNGVSEFKASEMILISQVLEIEDVENYFFDQKVRNIERQA